MALHKLTGAVQHREVGIRAVEVLAERFNQKRQFYPRLGLMDGCELFYSTLYIHEIIAV